MPDFRTLVEELPAVFYQGTRGRLLDYVSPQVETLFGTRPEVWIGDPDYWWSRVHPDDQERVRRETAPEKPYALEYRMLRADGGWRTVRDTGVHRGGLVRGFLIDLTDRAFLEMQFLQAQKLDAIGRLAGGIAHDFNNVLTVVTGYSDLLLADLKPEDPARATILEIQAASKRGTTLTRRLLSFSRKEEVRPQPVDLHVLVSGLRSMIRGVISEDIHLEFAGTHAGPVLIDPGYLEQAIVNLVVNARDAMPAGGTILIETGEVDVEPAHPQLSPGRYGMVLVRDNGCGMDAEIQARLFEPFFTTKSAGKGTGLGLATAWSIVRQAGGAITVESAVGHGSAFRILLPRVSRPDEGPATILLVDDEEKVRFLAARILRSKGYRVFEAPDGEHALSMAREHRDPIHLLMADQVMPKMSGIELAAEIVKIHPESQVMILSGYAEDRGVLRPEYAFLEKPFTFEGLLGRVGALLGKTSG